MLRTLPLKIYRGNIDLKDYMNNQSHLQTVNNRRSAVKIAVIDDDVFAPQSNLLSYGYNVNPIGDIKHTSEVAPYHLLLVDIVGVGRHFDKVAQGASLIEEIKKTYPEKIVVAYTGAGFNEKASRLARSRADRTLRKDIDIEEWITALDSLAIEAVDPYVIWKKIRQRFVELDVQTKDIMILEDCYVRSVLSKDESFRNLVKLSVDRDMRQDVRAVIQGLASSLIFKAIFGS